MVAAWDACCCCSPEGHVPGIRRKDVAPRAEEEEVELSPEIVALLVLLGAVVAAVVFTVVIVLVVDPSDADTHPPDGDAGARDREGEKR